MDVDKTRFRSFTATCECIPETTFLRTREVQRLEYLADILFQQNECLALIGPAGSGKSTIAKLLMHKKEEKLSIGWMYASPMLNTQTARKYIDSFYVVKKKHIATPANWKSIVFVVEDIHMCYPSSTGFFVYNNLDLQLSELFRMWENWRGYYDLTTYRFKSVSCFSLLYTAEESQISSSVHLHRLINSAIRILLPEPSECQQTLFVKNWLSQITE